MRYIGDSMEPFEEDDLVLVGSGLPHRWTNKDNHQGNSEAIVIHFQEDFLGNDFLNKPEFTYISSLFDKAKQGVVFSRTTAKNIKPRIKRLLDINGLERLLEFLSILEYLEKNGEYKLLSSPSFIVSTDKRDCDRVNSVCNYVINNLNQEISLPNVASLVHMTPNYFCRYFKKITHKTFVTFVNEVKIGHACRLLIETDNTISQVSFASGFRNITNFNKQFKAIKKMSPSEYRSNFKLSVYYT